MRVWCLTRITMKTTLIFILSRTLLVWAASTAFVALASDEPKTKPEYRTDVVFFERDKFTDVKDGSLATEKGRDDILDQLKTYLQQRAQSYAQGRAETRGDGDRRRFGGRF